MVRLEYAIVLAVARFQVRISPRRPGAPLPDVRSAARGEGLPLDRGQAVAYYAAATWWWVAVVAIFGLAAPLAVITHIVVGVPVTPMRDVIPSFALVAAGAVAMSEFAVISLRARWTEFFDRRADRRVRSRTLSGPLDFWVGVAFAALAAAGPLYAAFSS